MFSPRLFLSIFLSLFLFAYAGFSQTDEEIITKFTQKQKELSDRTKIQTLFQEFKVSMMGMEMPNKLWLKGDNIRYESSFMGQTQSFVITANGGWQIQNGTTTDIPTEQLQSIRSQIMKQTLAGNIDLNEDFNKDANNYEIVGREKINNVNCYKLRLTPKDTENAGYKEGFFWFEPNTFLVRKISFKQEEMGNEQNVDIFVKDYQQVKGLTFPKLIEMFIGNDQNIKIEYTTIKVNEPIDDSLFKK